MSETEILLLLKKEIYQLMGNLSIEEIILNRTLMRKLESALSLLTFS